MIRSIPVSSPAYHDLSDLSRPELLLKSTINLSEFVLSNPFTRHKYHVSKSYDIEEGVTSLGERITIAMLGVYASAGLIAASFIIFKVASLVIKDIPLINSGIEFYKKSIAPVLEKNQYLPALPKISFANAAKMGAASLVMLKTINRFQITTALIDKAINTPRPEDTAAIRSLQLKAIEFKLDYLALKGRISFQEQVFGSILHGGEPQLMDDDGSTLHGQKLQRSDLDGLIFPGQELQWSDFNDLI